MDVVEVSVQLIACKDLFVFCLFLHSLQHCAAVQSLNDLAESVSGGDSQVAATGLISLAAQLAFEVCPHTLHMTCM